MNPDPAELFAALNHVLRRRILRILDADDKRLESPSKFARKLDLPLSKVNYHINVLARAGAVELAETRVGRGAEHFYRLTLYGWTDWVYTALEACRESDGDGPARLPLPGP
jgi:DNA-binding transcriptional ArsR family regulator